MPRSGSRVRIPSPAPKFSLRYGRFLKRASSLCRARSAVWSTGGPPNRKLERFETPRPCRLPQDPHRRVPCGSSLLASQEVHQRTVAWPRAGNKLDGRRVPMKVNFGCAQLGFRQAGYPLHHALPRPHARECRARSAPLSSPPNERMVATASASTDTSEECSRKLAFSKPPSPANRITESRPCEFSTGRVVKI